MLNIIQANVFLPLRNPQPALVDVLHSADEGTSPKPGPRHGDYNTKNLYSQLARVAINPAIVSIDWVDVRIRKNTF